MWALVWIPVQASIGFLEAGGAWASCMVGAFFGYLITGGLDRIPFMWSKVDGVIGFIAFNLLFLVEGALRLTFCWVFWL